MTPTQAPVRLAVIVASTREVRFGDTVATWVRSELAKRPDFAVDVIDLRDVDLPATVSTNHPKSGRYTDTVASYAERIGAADAYLFLTPEYNHGYPASLKTALDAVYSEWGAKPASFVSYGGMSGGIRAVEQLRQVLAELHVVAIRDIVALPMVFGMFDDAGELRDGLEVEQALKLTLDRLLWWATSLRTAREHSPYAG